MVISFARFHHFILGLAFLLYRFIKNLVWSLFLLNPVETSDILSKLKYFGSPWDLWYQWHLAAYPKKSSKTGFY